MIDLEIELVKAFNWSLRDIDETDIQSLLPFVNRFAGIKREEPVRNKVYCDQVSWL
jgi:hypothetical protein